MFLCGLTSRIVGQTPRKLFSSPHPPRNLQGILSLPVRTSRGVPEDALALTRDPRPLKGKARDGFVALLYAHGFAVALDGPVACVVIDASGKVIPMPEGLLSPPSRPDEQVQWGKDGTLRVLHYGTVNVARAPVFEDDGQYSFSGFANDRSCFPHLRCVCRPRYPRDWIERFPCTHLAAVSRFSVNDAICGFDDQGSQGPRALTDARPSSAQA